MAATTDRCACRIIHRQTVEAAQRTALPSGEVEEAARLFKALGDPSRLRILWALHHHELCVCDLAALLGLSESAVSHQLRHLRTLRLVRNQRQGQVLLYRLDDNHVGQLLTVALEHLRENKEKAAPQPAPPSPKPGS